MSKKQNSNKFGKSAGFPSYVGVESSEGVGEIVIPPVKTGDINFRPPNPKGTEEKAETLVVNLLGGPGTGKSSVRAGVFHDLKFHGINCEEATEYAKELTWEKRKVALRNQIHIFGEQHHRIWKLLNQVDVVITDSPLLLTPIYDQKERETLLKLTLEEFNAMWNYNVLLVRCRPYNSSGRNHTEAEAKEIDSKITDFLLDHRIPFETAGGDASGKNKIVKQVLRLLGRKT